MLSDTQDKRLKNIEEMLLSLTAGKKTRHTAVTDVINEGGEKLRQSRVEAVERIFWRLVNSPELVRQKTYHFPSYIMNDDRENHNEIVLKSVLVNQCALRKLFGSHEDVNDAIRHSNLWCGPVSATKLERDSNTLVVMSPDEADRLVRDTSTLPREWKGWSVTERGQARQNINGEWVEKKPDKCGMRSWGEENTQIESTKITVTEKPWEAEERERQKWLDENPDYVADEDEEIADTSIQDPDRTSTVAEEEENFEEEEDTVSEWEKGILDKVNGVEL